MHISLQSRPKNIVFSSRLLFVVAEDGRTFCNCPIITAMSEQSCNWGNHHFFAHFFHHTLFSLVFTLLLIFVFVFIVVFVLLQEDDVLDGSGQFFPIASHRGRSDEPVPAMAGSDDPRQGPPLSFGVFFQKQDNVSLFDVVFFSRPLSSMLKSGEVLLCPTPPEVLL